MHGLCSAHRPESVEFLLNIRGQQRTLIPSWADCRCDGMSKRAFVESELAPGYSVVNRKSHPPHQVTSG